MKFCVFCGKPLRTDAMFCSSCGKPIAAAPVSKQDPAPKAEAYRRPVSPAATVVTPAETTRARRTNKVYRFVSVPTEWQNGAVEAQPPEPKNRTAAAKPPVNVGADRRPPVQTGVPTRTQVEKRIPAERQATAPAVRRKTSAKKIETRAYGLLSLFAALALLLIPPAVFTPYCRIAYSSSRAAGMSLWKLLFGGTFTLSGADPVRFTLCAHPELLALLLLPLPALLPLCFRKAKARLSVSAFLLIAEGLAVLLWNGAALQKIQGTVSGLSLETFQKEVVSMNDVLFRWVQTVLAGGRSFANRFAVTGGIGYGLIGLFGWLTMLFGVAGTVLFVILLFRKEEPKHARMRADDDDVPELTGEWL